MLGKYRSFFLSKFFRFLLVVSQNRKMHFFQTLCWICDFIQIHFYHFRLKSLPNLLSPPFKGPALAVDWRLPWLVSTESLSMVWRLAWACPRFLLVFCPVVAVLRSCPLLLVTFWLLDAVTLINAWIFGTIPCFDLGAQITPPPFIFNFRFFSNSSPCGELYSNPAGP